MWYARAYAEKAAQKIGWQAQPQIQQTEYLKDRATSLQCPNVHFTYKTDPQKQAANGPDTTFNDSVCCGVGISRNPLLLTY